jgi:hypothetical protein
MYERSATDELEYSVMFDSKKRYRKNLRLKCSADTSRGAAPRLEDGVKLREESLRGPKQP